MSHCYLKLLSQFYPLQISIDFFHLVCNIGYRLQIKISFISEVLLKAMYKESYKKEGNGG